MADQEEQSQWETRNTTDTDKEEQRPDLYSKTLILVFAILFSTIFAAILLIINLRSLGKKKEAIWVLLFAIGYLFATAIVIQAFSLDPGLTVIANVIGAAILNEYFWNKYIGADVDYKRKSWIKPILVGLLIVMLVFFFMMGSM